MLITGPILQVRKRAGEAEPLRTATRTQPPGSRGAVTGETKAPENAPLFTLALLLLAQQPLSARWLSAGRHLGMTVDILGAAGMGRAAARLWSP